MLIESHGLQASDSKCSAKSPLVHSQKGAVECKGIIFYGPYMYSIITTTSNHSPGGQHEGHIIRLLSRLTNAIWISDQSHSHGWALHICIHMCRSYRLHLPQSIHCAIASPLNLTRHQLRISTRAPTRAVRSTERSTARLWLGLPAGQAHRSGAVSISRIRN